MSDYKMPKVEIGDPALWSIEGSPDPQHAHAAVITRVHADTVDMTVFVPQRNPIQKFNVRHVSDPYLQNEMSRDMKREAGGWDIAPVMKRLAALESALKDINSSKSSRSSK